MSPAFSSSRQAVAFAVLVGALIAAPAALPKVADLDRRAVYPAIPVRYGPFSWIQQQIFDETEDVDVAFIGSSHIWNAIETPYVQKEFSRALGRDARVISLCWPWSGFDSTYVIANDLLKHRRVRMLVTIDDAENGSIPHMNSSRFFRIGENSESLAGLPLISKLRLYGSAVLGMPRHLLSLVRSNLIEDPLHCGVNYWNTSNRAPNIAENLGALRSHLGFGYSPDYVDFRPMGTATGSDAVIYSSLTRSAFEFTGPTLETYQLHFARELGKLCQKNGTRLVILHTPNIAEQSVAVIREREFWPEAFSAPVDIVGIPPVKLFAGIPPADAPKLFYDNLHLNENGEEFFTPLITPALLKLYETPINKP